MLCNVLFSLNKQHGSASKATRVSLYQYEQVVNGGLFNCNRMGGKAIVLHAAEGKFCPVAAFQSIIRM